ncbi:MAG: replicative DNA helicase [Fibrobacter sp.]|nr:replicative DNA helicase [Fibrobacter sp.]
MMNNMVPTSLEPPHALEAETHLLGGLMQDSDMLPECLEVITAEDFYWEKHQMIFRAMMHLDQEAIGIDAVTIAEHLQTQEELTKVGGQEYLFTLMESVASAANARFHADIIKQKSLLRGLLKTSQQVVREALDPSANPTEVIERAEQKIFEISQQQVSDSLQPIGAVMDIVLQMIERYSKDDISGCPTGFRDLDKLTNGLQKSDLIILAGRPAMGKTALALTLAANAAIVYNKKVAFFSLEMGAEQLVQRVLCSRAEINMNLLRTGRLPNHEYKKIPMFSDEIVKSKLYIDDQASLSITELRSKCRNLARRQGLDLIVVDYLQLMDVGKAENRSVAIGNVSRGLKIMAKELDVPVLSLAQLSRKAEDPSRKGRPMLSDLRESGSIEQDADMVWFIHRPWIYNRDDERGPNYAELVVAKHRNGPIEDIPLFFAGEYATFRDYTAAEAPDDGGFGSFDP